jgi:hypothetical protein
MSGKYTKEEKKLTHDLKETYRNDEDGLTHEDRKSVRHVRKELRHSEGESKFDQYAPLVHEDIKIATLARDAGMSGVPLIKWAQENIKYSGEVSEVGAPQATPKAKNNEIER